MTISNQWQAAEDTVLVVAISHTLRKYSHTKPFERYYPSKRRFKIIYYVQQAASTGKMKVHHKFSFGQVPLSVVPPSSKLQYKDKDLFQSEQVIRRVLNPFVVNPNHEFLGLWYSAP